MQSAFIKIITENAGKSTIVDIPRYDFLLATSDASRENILHMYGRLQQQAELQQPIKLFMPTVAAPWHIDEGPNMHIDPALESAIRRLGIFDSPPQRVGTKGINRPAALDAPLPTLKLNFNSEKRAGPSKTRRSLAALTDTNLSLNSLALENKELRSLAVEKVLGDAPVHQPHAKKWAIETRRYADQDIIPHLSLNSLALENKELRSLAVEKVLGDAPVHQSHDKKWAIETRSYADQDIIAHWLRKKPNSSSATSKKAREKSTRLPEPSPRILLNCFGKVEEIMIADRVNRYRCSQCAWEYIHISEKGEGEFVNNRGVNVPRLEVFRAFHVNKESASTGEHDRSGPSWKCFLCGTHDKSGVGTGWNGFSAHLRKNHNYVGIPMEMSTDA